MPFLGFAIRTWVEGGEHIPLPSDFRTSLLEDVNPELVRLLDGGRGDRDVPDDDVATLLS